MTSSESGKSSTTNRIVEAIEDDIIFGRLRPRERLIEDELTQRFGVKRHIVRQALTDLQALGIVTKRPNKGACVRDFSPAEVCQIYDMRVLLQREAATRIPLPARPQLVERLRRIYDAYSKGVDEQDLRRVYHLNNEFHDTLFAACGNPYLNDAIRHYAWFAHAIRSYRIADPRQLQEARSEHRLMIEALEQQNREDLIRLCVDHIRPSMEAYLSAQGAAADSDSNSVRIEQSHATEVVGPASRR